MVAMRTSWGWLSLSNSTKWRLRDGTMLVPWKEESNRGISLCFSPVRLCARWGILSRRALTIGRSGGRDAIGLLTAEIAENTEKNCGPAEAFNRKGRKEPAQRSRENPSPQRTLRITEDRRGGKALTAEIAENGEKSTGGKSLLQKDRRECRATASVQRATGKSLPSLDCHCERRRIIRLRMIR